MIRLIPAEIFCRRPTAGSSVLCLTDAGIAELADRLGREVMRVLLAAHWLIAVSPVGDGFLEVIKKNKCFHTVVLSCCSFFSSYFLSASWPVAPEQRAFHDAQIISFENPRERWPSERIPREKPMSYLSLLASPGPARFVGCGFSQRFEKKGPKLLWFSDHLLLLLVRPV